MVNKGLRLIPGCLDRALQVSLLAAVRKIIAGAPLYRPVMPRSGQPFSVLMANAGPLGWVSDKTGYRYQDRHPATGDPWPDIPAQLIGIWNEIVGGAVPPECCLVNYYAGPPARMGLHRDDDEDAPDVPVLSLSLGDSAKFRIGGLSRRDRTRSFTLSSGDALVLGGDARHAYHGIDRIIAGSSTLLREGGRFNLTLRRVTRPGVA